MRSRSLFFLSLAVLAGVLFSPAAWCAGELLSNPDFEEWSGGLPTGWLAESGVTITQDTATVHTGLSAVNLLTTGSTNAGIFQEVPIAGGVPYEFTCWVYADNVNASGTGILVNWLDASMVSLGSTTTRYNELVSTWEQVTTGPVTAPAAAAFARVRIRMYENSPATADIVDDANFQEVSLDLTNGFSSEWDATAFNGGRKMVRDADGYFHAVYHSQMDTAAIPGNPVSAPRPCAIYYTHTIRPVEDLPPPLTAVDWVPPVAIAGTDDVVDDRYPCIAINYDPSPDYSANDQLHVVWQKESSEGGVYDICYATITNEPPFTGTWVGPGGNPSSFWLYQSYMDNRDSLVPVVDVSNNFVHVAWQEENFTSVDMVSFYSEILYKVSYDPTWQIPTAYLRNLSNSPETNSQMPSISVAHDDRYTTAYTYPSTEIWVVWNDDYVSAGAPPHIWLARSANNGWTWDTAGGITGGTEISVLAGTDQDGYPCIIVEPWNGPGTGADHIVWMDYVTPADPDGYELASGRGIIPLTYDPGVDPTVSRCFPGPDPGMYGAAANRIYYYSVTFSAGGYYIGGTSTRTRDCEFPTITTNGQGRPGETQRLWVNWQEYYNTVYNIIQDSIPIDAAALSSYANWWSTNEIVGTNDEEDDLFPNLAAKKHGMYWPTGRELVFTDINASGSMSAMMPQAKTIMFSSSSEWENTKPDFTTWHIPVNNEPPVAGITMRNPLAPVASDATAYIYCGAWPQSTIWGGVIQYRKMDTSNGAAWNTAVLSFDSNHGSNEYWIGSFPISGTFTAGDVVEYYLSVSSDPTTTSTQYVYGNDTSSYTTRVEVVAQGSPYRFTVLAPPTATPTATDTPTPADTATPTVVPTETPTPEPTATYTPGPSPTPTETPTEAPTATPTDVPTSTPTHVPHSGTHHTIVTDGTNDFDDPEELLGDCGGDTFWLTWDASNIYFGFDNFDYHTSDFFVYLDTDGLAGGDSQVMSWNSATHTFPDTFRPDYCLAVEDYDTPQYFALRYWDGAAWQDPGNQGGIASSWFDAAGLTEIAVSWSDLGNPSYLKVICIEMYETAADVFCAFPTDNPTGADPLAFTHYYLFEDLGTGIYPGDSGYVIDVAARQAVVLNEYLASPGSVTDWNNSGTADFQDEWIELFLPTGNGNADLEGCIIDDIDAGGSTAHTVTGPCRLPGDDYKVFYQQTPTLSVVGAPDDTVYLYGTGLGLNSGGDTVRYVDLDSTEIDTHTYSTNPGTDIVWRRCADGDNNWETAADASGASPGQTNPCTGPTATPTHTPTATSTPEPGTPTPTATETPVPPTATATPTTAPATATPTPDPGNPMNVWHIPENEEPPSVTMRNPLYVAADTATIYIYCGGYPASTIWSGTLYHREQGSSTWNTSTFNFDSTSAPNEYWMASFDRAVNGYDQGDTVEYYLAMSGDSLVYDITYVYGDDSSSTTTTVEATAQASPYTFEVMGAVPATSPLGIALMLLAFSGLLGLFGLRRS